MIISASRRTDIPAFYSEWFMNRIRSGFLLTRNPFNTAQIKRVSLQKSDVDAIVFWSRNPEKLLPYLKELDERQFNYYFQFTITGYPRSIEKSVPNPYKAIETFQKLSEMIGSDKVIWRYDPILLSNIVDVNEHKRLFKKIANELRYKTKRVVISFADFYRKTERNLTGIIDLHYEDILNHKAELHGLLEYLVDVAAQNNMEILSCAEKLDFAAEGVKHGKCIDDELINRLFNLSIKSQKDPGQRKECGCVRSIDIGQYNTCAHQCSYCYATYSSSAVAKNRKLHNPQSPFLIGTADNVDPELIKPSNLQQSIFDKW
jgi:DNA repair photolyase